jgi:hypothetical protein
MEMRKDEMQTIDVLINKYIDLIDEKDDEHGISIAEANFYDEINPDWYELEYTELEAMKDNNKQAYLNALVEYYNAM